MKGGTLGGRQSGGTQARIRRSKLLIIAVIAQSGGSRKATHRVVTPFRIHGNRVGGGIDSETLNVHARKIEERTWCGSRGGIVTRNRVAIIDSSGPRIDTRSVGGETQFLGEDTIGLGLWPTSRGNDTRRQPYAVRRRSEKHREICWAQIVLK